MSTAPRFVWIFLPMLISSCVGASETPSGSAQAETTTAEAARIPSLHTVWSLPAPPDNADKRSGYYNIDSRLLITRDPGSSEPLYWAAYFGILASDGAGGYIGLQDGAPRADGTTGKMAIFSIWNATSGQPGPDGAWCQTFDGEGTGVSCRIAYEWAQDHTYRLRVWELSPGAWRGAVMDEQTNVETVLGDITVSSNWGRLDAALDNFTENFGMNGSLGYPSCVESPHVAATFFAPTANAVTVKATGATPSVNSDANCANVVSRVDPDLGSAVHEMNP